MVARIVSIGPAIAVATGVAWALFSLRASSDVHEWASVVVFSTALALLGPGAVLLADLDGWTRAVRAGTLVVAFGGLVAAVGNVIEDGIGIAAFGDLFAAGLAGVLLGLPFLACVFALNPPRWPAVVALATFVGMFASQQAMGGFLVLVAWLVVACAAWRRGAAHGQVV